MSDDPKKHARDSARINVHQDHEVAYWTKSLGVTKERLRRLVEDNGDRVEDVRRALGRQHA